MVSWRWSSSLPVYREHVTRCHRKLELRCRPTAGRLILKGNMKTLTKLEAAEAALIAGVQYVINSEGKK